MNILEFFAGSRSFSKAAIEQGHRVFTTDCKQFGGIDYVVDVLKFNTKRIPFLTGKPDIIWASPPCTTFSVAGRNSNYTNFVPNSTKACLGLAYVYRTIELIKELEPKWWFIENPRGYLRKFPCMADLPRNTVTYCQYGEERMKPTDIWTNCETWKPRPICKNGDPCHVRAPRGSKTGTQGLKNNHERSKIPHELCKEILQSISTE